MQKDVIYIDVDDDITAIIDKVKSSQQKIIALVPPKRTGVLQSAVNLRLVNRAATQQDKRLVIITGDTALTVLAAAASIPVAKNLQSKPELADVTALSVDDDDDIIDGAELPVGDHARMAEGADPSTASDVASAGIAAANETRKAAPPVDGKSPKTKVKRGMTVPNFDTFRKKLILVALGVLLLIAALVWAIFFAPRATVAVTTRTTDAAVSQQVTLNPDAETSPTSSVIKAATKTSEDEVSVEFSGTGKKDVGEFAKGTVTFETDSYSRLLRGITIPAGTELTSSSGAVYATDSTVELSISSGNSGSTGITAAERGENYNGASGSVNGAPAGVDAEITDTTSGGTDKTVTVATASDIEKARRAALDEINPEAALEDLTKQFGEEYVILDDALQTDTSSLKSSVKADEEANSPASYGGTIKYTLYAVAKTELDDYLKSVIEQQIDDTDTQRVYETGAQDTQFTNVDKTSDGMRAALSTNGKVGPKIDEDQVKQLAIGKRIGDIKAAIEVIDGVDSVDVTLSPFWVNTAPKEVEKITVKFTLDD